MQVAQAGARVCAELVGEGGPDTFVRRKCLGLPAIGVQGSDQELVEAFAERVGDGEAFELGDQVAGVTAGDGGLGQVLGGGEPELGQAVRLDRGERQVAQVGEGLTAPELARPG